MTTPPKSPDGLTISIPNWHHKNYLPRSVGSALAAARALAKDNIRCEILVLDDNSRDGSQRLLASMALMDKEGFLHPILSPQNRGLAAMRNLALERARYRWVCSLDADNELAPDNLAAFYHAAKNTAAALVYGNLLCRNHSEVTGLCSNDVIRENILTENYIDAMAIVDAEQVLDLGGFDNHPYSRTHEDWELILHLMAEGRQITFVPAVLGIYHNVPLSMIKETGYDHSKMHRMFNQRKTGLPRGFTCHVYHPALGTLI